jgi:hypothetical protein
VATAGTAVLVILLVWAAGALLGSASADSVQGTANQRPAGVPLTSMPASNPPSAGRLFPAGMSSWPSSSSQTSAPALTSVPGAPPAPGGPAAPSVTLTPTTTTTPPPPPGPPQPCPDNVIKVSTTVGQPSYQVGQRPAFTLHIANIGPVACIRDVSRPLRAILVVPVTPGPPLWSSDDCYPEPVHDIRTLQPGQEATYSVAWAGRTSAPGCPAQRSTVPAGNYAVVGQLGPLAGAPTPFSLT